MRPAPFDCWLIGADSLLLGCADLLLERGHRILGVISDVPPVAAWCDAHAIRRVAPAADLAAVLAEAPFDYLLSIANLRVVAREVLALPRRGSVNFHDGPLPRYGGLHAPAWALMAGEREYAVTWHWMTDRVDTGDIVLQRRFPVGPEDRALDLNTRCLQAGLESFPDLLTLLARDADQVPRQRQTLDRGTYHGRAERPRALGWLGWTRPPSELAALARALDFGAYRNPLTLPKLVAGDRAVLVGAITPLAPAPGARAAPGTVLGSDAAALQVATAEGAVSLTRLRTIDGAPLDPAAALAELAIAVGEELPPLDGARADAVDAFVARTAGAEDFWVSRLAGLEPIALPYAEHGAAPARVDGTLAFAAHGDRDVIARAFVLYAARLAGRSHGDLAFREAGAVGAPGGLTPFFSQRVPLRVALEREASVGEADAAIAQEFALLRARAGFARDAIARTPDLAPLAGRGFDLPVGLELVDHLDDRRPPGNDLTLVLSAEGEGLWCYDVQALHPRHVAAIDRQFAGILGAITDRARRWATLPLMEAAEQRMVLEDWNATAREPSAAQCLHHLIEAQAARTPDATAIVFETSQYSYGELNARANRLARHLRSLGARPDSLVAVACDRSLDMVVAVLAVLKSGAAYVPLDPSYPAARLQMMLEDSRAAIVLTQSALLGELPATHARLVSVDLVVPNGPPEDAADLTDGAGPSDLAYCIFTSGSTGRPKGVMVEHRNVLNFCAAMDARLGTAPGVWLAVTSLSFDISVLELLWTLTRGYKVVIHADEPREEGPAMALANAHKRIDFSLFYFSADGGGESDDRYRMLLEGARFGDTHGFSAVWTPERHFHAFGGLYPNPAVTGAAIAATTTRIGVRAGSCVLPLHHPVRVAEEWAMVDNLSHGRVGVSFAAGWQPDDFVLQPENYATAKATTVAMMETVRRLWRGEAVGFPGPRGEVLVRTLPRPVQPELPVWFTTAGDPESYALAGRLGVNLLTHLLGQTVSELGDRITLYRKARKAAGHAGEGQVALMLHTFVGETEEEVRGIVRGPLKAYLATSVNLIKGYAAAFPTFKKNADGSIPDVDLGRLSAAEMDALLEYSAERYAAANGLFGTVESCAAMVDRLKGVGVDDVACLVDFGVETELALKHLRHLNRLRARTSRARQAFNDRSIGAQITRHGVTHLQCTPSLATMLAATERDRDALRGLTVLCVGGEVFPPALGEELRRLVLGDVLNLYGPTETTIWSTAWTLEATPGAVPIGRPVANTELLVLDAFGEPVPPGVAGELFIGGAGVTRGYWDRPELTRERFLPHPLRAADGARVYRTGDVVRWREDGVLEFLGRADHQVKIRGHRIELGEVEAAIAASPMVRECAVVARAGGAAARLSAYVVWRDGVPGDIGDLRERLREILPEYAVPSQFIELARLPRTPNGKIDRQSLPAEGVRPSGAPPLGAVAAEGTAPGGSGVPTAPLEALVAGIWREVLALPSVGLDDNFVEIGGRSLLAVQVHSRLRQQLGREISVTDLFRFPTIRTLAAFLTATDEDAGTQLSVDRALARREVIARRRRGTQSR